jgi:hypothetical protein
MTGRKSGSTKGRKDTRLTAAHAYAKTERTTRDEAAAESGPLMALGKGTDDRPGLGWASMTTLMPPKLWDALRVHAVTNKLEMSVLVAELVEAELVRKGQAHLQGIVAAELSRRPIRKTGGAA